MRAPARGRGSKASHERLHYARRPQPPLPDPLPRFAGAREDLASRGCRGFSTACLREGGSCEPRSPGGSQQPLVAAIGIAAGAGRTSPRPRLRQHGGARPGRAAPGGQRRTRQLEAARARAAVEPELVVDVLDAEDVVGDVLEGALLVAALDGPRERHLAGRDRHLHLAGVDPAAGDPLAHLVADPLVGAAVPLRPEAAPPREGIAPLSGGLVEARVDPACAAARPDVPVLTVRGAAPRPAIPLLALASHRSLSSRRVADGRAKGKLHTRATRAP